MQPVGRLFIAGQKEAVVCRWQLDGSHLVLSPNQSDPPYPGGWKLDVNQSNLTLAGFNEDQLVLKVGDLVFYGQRAELEKPLRALGLERIHRALSNESRRVRSNVRKSYVWLGVLTVLLGMLVGIGWWVTDRVVDGATALTPIGWDVELGKVAWNAQQSRFREIRDAAVVEPLSQCLRQLSQPYREQGFVFQMHVVDDPQVNAFALPGGQLIVCRGLLEQSEGPEELVGVLAHEIEHVVLRHGVRAIYSQLRWQLALAVLVGDGNRLHAGLMGSGAALAGLSYSREAESEADLQGLALLDRLGWPDQGLVKFFKKLDGKQGTTEQNLKYLSTHPASADRIAALEQRMSKAPRGGSIPIDWDSLEQALGKGAQDASRGRQQP